jgi:hypothetical protein
MKKDFWAKPIIDGMRLYVPLGSVLVRAIELW